MATVLIVDDNKMNLQVLGSILSENGYKVAASLDGMSVPKLIDRVSPEIIILDVMMPVMDGFEVCEKLKQNDNYKDIPVIFLTAKTDTDSITRGFSLGGVDYVTKPFRKEELLARVKTHIELTRGKKLIEKQAKDLEALNQLKNKIFSVISNDLHGTVRIFSEIYSIMNDPKVQLDAEDLKDLFLELRNKSNIASALLENILWWSKSQRNLLSVRTSKISVKDIYTKLKEIFAEPLNKKQIQLEYSGDKNAFIIGDNEQLMIVFKNLIDNAIKYSNRNSKINLLVSTDGDKTTCEIIDSGIGMDEETMTKAIDKFEFFSTPGTENEKGTGIGILLSEELIAINNGEILFNSEIGKGTTVKLTLPADI